MNRPGDRLTMGLLPERHMDWRTFCFSYGAQALLVIFLLIGAVLIPEQMGLVTYHLTPMIALKPYEPPKPPRLKTTPRIARLTPAPEPVPVVIPKLLVPPEVRHPKTQQAEVEAPKLNNFPTVAPAVLKQTSGPLPSVVHTGAFTGSAVTPTVVKPVDKVQTGGFGDPNGLKGEGKPGAHLVAAQMGSFDMPVGPGQGNGSGGAKGVKGTVASADFGSGIATPGHGDGRSGGRGSVQNAGFGATQAVAPSGSHVAQAQSPINTPVEIISKPTPAYTQEARQLKLEGEVLLEILFTADGRVQVQRVVRGLGHGLDEAAVAAATKMRFKPSMRNGQAVDSTAVVHVVFQLAY